ncbi:hypothetical protein [Ferruginibacter sp.]|nr:hypothetical protein [Ferruginibacter sp.]
MPKCLASFSFSLSFYKGWGEVTTLRQHRAKVQTSWEAGNVGWTKMKSIKDEFIYPLFNGNRNSWPTIVLV